MKFQIELDKLSYGTIKTEIVILDKFYLAEGLIKSIYIKTQMDIGLKGTGASTAIKIFPKPNVKKFVLRVNVPKHM